MSNAYIQIHTTLSYSISSEKAQKYVPLLISLVYAPNTVCKLSCCPTNFNSFSSFINPRSD